MAKYQQYEEYKDSGIEWLGRIPNHWQLRRIQESANIINGYPFESSKFKPTKGTPLVRIRDIRNQKAEVCFDGFVPEVAVINNGDILIGMDGDFNVAKWAGGKAALNQRVACVRHENSITQSFLYYLLPFNMKIVNDLTYYTTVKHLSSNDILKTTFALPSEAELKSIVSFLDHETAQIDTLIEKQQTLIQLLKEKRQTVISHAVTKGLNSDAPMKDSGVEWLGEVPEHWEVLKLKRLVSFSQGVQVDLGLQKHEESDKSVRFLRIENYTQNSSDYRFINPTLSQGKFVSQDELVMVRYGASAGYVGRGLEGVLANNLFKISPTTNTITNNFLSSFLKNSYEYFQKEMSGSAMPALNFSMIENLIITLPPIDEQKQIADHIDKMQSYFDSLTDRAEQAIQLMQERRTALISAAVTGKIDVRGWVAPE